MINMKKMNKKQAGFTLIELVMVIVILGILSAFALPRFADLGGDARKAVLNGALGSIKAASAVVHSAALANGTANLTEIGLEGVNIQIINNYPEAHAAGIIAAAQIDSSDFTISTGGTTATSAITIDVIGAATAATCRISYTAAGAGATPTIALVSDAGC